MYGSADVAILAINFLLLPIYTRVLLPAEYGVLALVLVLEAVLKPLYRWGLNTSFLRLYYDCRNDADRKTLAGTAIIFLLGANGGLTVVLLVVAPVLSNLLFGTRDHALILSLRFCCKVWDHARESVGWTSLRGQSKHLVDQLRLPDHVALRHPSRLSLAERMHDLDAAQGPPRRGESLEAQHRPGAAFDESVVLLDDVVQILALAKIRTRSDESLVSDGLERDRVGGVLVHGHHARGVV